jgi:glycosyltransferase involved in cell wall biosynthesis
MTSPGMRIVMVAVNDPAGTAISFARALNACTPHRCRVVTLEIRYNFLFEKDLHMPWLKEYGELEQVLRDADLFHFHMTADEDLPLGPFRVRDFLRGRPVVHHHHGEPPFRADPRRFAEREISLGRRAIVSTPDLLRGYPEAAWIPNPVPINDPDYRPHNGNGRNGSIVVGHSPTRTDLKNTAEFRAVMARIARRDPRVRARIIENTRHRDCLRLKRECDVFFDHMQGYFGVSSLESLSQGVPTIAGLDEWNLDQVRRFAGGGDAPWVIARDAESLERRVADLAGDPALRGSIGKASRRWMERCWTEERIAARLSAFYGEAA